MRKLRVGVLFGARSGEHDVSLRSAASILRAIKRRKYAVIPVGITRNGKWLFGNDALRLIDGKYKDTIWDARDVRRANHGATELTSALKEAAKYDGKIIVEQGGRRKKGESSRDRMRDSRE